LAQEINSGMPLYVKERIAEILNEAKKPINGSKILLVGVTYKPNIADERESPVRPLARALIEAGAELSYFDPFVPTWNIDRDHGSSPDDRLLDSVSDVSAAIADVDLVVVLQPHRNIDFATLLPTAKRVLDTRGIFTAENVVRL
jgi:UDP-N-acetyl-D-mannosaminuronate dehydrogenase